MHHLGQESYFLLIAIAACRLTLAAQGLPSLRQPEPSSRSSPTYVPYTIQQQACTPAPVTGNRSKHRTLLPGRYRLIVVAISDSTPPQQVAGGLLLRSEVRAATTRGGGISFPFWGSTDVDLTRLGQSSIAYDPSSNDVRRPGVQILHDADDGSYTMVLGNAATRWRMPRTDSGVYFDVGTSDAHGFSGTWRDGGRSASDLHGYFCAMRRNV